MEYTFLLHLQREIMEMCQNEGLHQVDLLSPAATKITQEEYMAKRRGQKNLDKINQKIKNDGLTPATTVFQTQKQFLRDAIDECAPLVSNFTEFQNMLLEKYNISVIENRGRYRYLHPDRDSRITEKALGAHYGKKYLEQIFKNLELKNNEPMIPAKTIASADYHSDPIAILYYKSQLRLVVDLQTNVKALQNQAYARKVKISNLQQMAKTIIYIQENSFDTREELKNSVNSTTKELKKAQEQLASLSEELKTLNAQIHFTGQYQAHKRTFSVFVNSKNKKAFRKEHAAEISAYEEARDWLKNFYPDGKMLSLISLKEKKSNLQKQIYDTKKQLHYLQEYHRDLETANTNVDEILGYEGLSKKRDEPTL